MSKHKPITWNTRDEATSTQQAIEALGDFLSSTSGILMLMQQGNNAPDRKTLLAVKSYAEKWKVPFSLSLLRTMVKETDRKRWRGETNEPEPKSADFSDRQEYWRAWDSWRQNAGQHHWVSSSESSNC